MTEFHKFSPVATAVGAGCIGRGLAWETLRDALAELADADKFRALVTEAAAYIAHVHGRAQSVPLSTLKRDRVPGAATLAQYAENLLWFYRKRGTIGLDTLTARGVQAMRAQDAAERSAARGEAPSKGASKTAEAAQPTTAVLTVADAIACIRTAAAAGALGAGDVQALQTILSSIPTAAPVGTVERVERAPLALAA